ncbi:MAG TPA: S53 family peptidase [Kofleriaceae bacterium]|nr:S53 family peptidase [Kofleriaceae bacterium]
MGDETVAPDGDETSSQPVCTKGRYHCHARIVTGGAARRISTRAVGPTPDGYGPADLQSAYRIDPKTIATSTPPTVAIIDAYGYAALEADLGAYRSQFGLPPCTIANGCLKIVNQLGQTTNLPPDPPADDDWRIETALDIDMASAACPKCKLLVVQAPDNVGDGLESSQATAVSLGAAVISNSWGGPENPQQPVATSGIEEFFNHPGVAIFVSAGDAGYNDQLGDLLMPKQPVGPDYPATSAHTIAVGATRLLRAPGTPRGWTESTWAPITGMPDHGAGGSACSNSVPKPAYQAASPCTFKATADIAAVGDPATGVAVYTSAVNGGWIVIGGTSASAPFVAAIFAAAGLGATASGAMLAASTAKLNDVTSGSNGTCGTQTLLCNAAKGWDGPTGFGTPNASAFIPGSTGTGTGSGSGGQSDTSGGDQDVSGGCSTGSGAGSGAGLLLGVALLGLRRRRRA